MQSKGAEDPTMEPSGLRFPADGTAVTRCLRAAHTRLRERLPDIERLARKGKFEDALRSAWRLSADAERVVTAEEELLFPRFRAVSGLAVGPIALMHADHLAIQRKLSSLVRATGTRDAPWASRSIAEIADLLTTHDIGEQGMLYAIVDQIAEEDAAADPSRDPRLETFCPLDA